MTKAQDPADRPQRIGVMGGTFDPIHHGHLVAASEVASRYHLDQVIFVPAGQPDHRSTQPHTTATHRYLMTEIATASNPRFTVSTVDVQRDGPTYTVDTLSDLRDSFPVDTQWFFIMGADAMHAFMSWKDPTKLLDMARFICVTRPGHSVDFGDVPPERVDVVQIPAMAISATDCRDRVERGEPVWYLVPDGVVQYIAKHQLYRSSS